MPRDGSKTRAFILDQSEKLVMQHGFAATSIDKILEATDLTKGAFFYHFKSKADLAEALIERYHQGERGLVNGVMERAEKLSREPLQQVLIALGLMIEVYEHPPGDFPGCMMASMSYSSDIWRDSTRESFAEAVTHWREVFCEKLEAAEKTHPPRLDVDLGAVADMVLCAFEGGYILERIMERRDLVRQQLINVRAYVELLFGAE